MTQADARPAILMAAPNGARRTKADHRGLPVTVAETVAEAQRCRDAGAAMLHAHVRGADGAHVLDVGLYRELIAEMRRAAPDMLVQITSEAVGRYAPEEMAAVVRSVRPDYVSVALREMAPEPSMDGAAAGFYAWCAEAGVHVQHIFYAPEDFQIYKRLCLKPDGGVFRQAFLFVLGRYADGQIADPLELDPFLSALSAHGGGGEGPRAAPPWFVCAFGPAEHAAARRALAAGGHVRVGFENNLALASGAPAPNTAALIREAAEAASAFGRPVADPASAQRVLIG